MSHPGATRQAPPSERPGLATVHGFLLAITCCLLLLLPFVTTFDDVLTRGAMWLGLDRAMQWLVPGEVRMVVGLLSLVGIPASAYHSELILGGPGYSQPLFVSWNCIGWQSLVLLALSLTTGLRGGLPFQARAQVILIGLLGTVLLNLARLAVIAVLAATAGYVPAALFHDYGGALMTVAWLFIFWAFAYRYLLPPVEVAA
jgi:exosortase/archaeosortase family protein